MAKRRVPFSSRIGGGAFCSVSSFRGAATSNGSCFGSFGKEGSAGKTRTGAEVVVAAVVAMVVWSTAPVGAEEEVRFTSIPALERMTGA